MTGVFTFRAPLERAYQRKVRFAVEAIDAVTLAPVWDGLNVKVKGLAGKPILSSSGRFVWLEESGANPTEVSIDPGRLPYLARTDPVPPQTLLRVELAPTTAYPFAAGITGVRGTLLRKRIETPLVAIEGAPVRLQWIDDNAAGTTWIDAPTASRTERKGDFVAVVRFAADQIARFDAQHRMRVRVAATHAGNTLFSPELQVPPGHVAEVQQSFAWDEFLP